MTFDDALSAMAPRALKTFDDALSAIVLRALRKNEDLDAEELADIVWLELQLSSAPRPTTDAQPQPVASPSHAVDEQPAASAPAPSEAATSAQLLPPLEPVMQQPGPAPAPVFTPEALEDAAAKASGAFREIAVPTAPALTEKRELTRRLRPLRRRVPSRTRSVLDEGATVRSSAEQRMLLPELRPAPERWLEVSLVVEEAGSMPVWRRAVDELRVLLEHNGAFRDVRMYALRASDDGQFVTLHTRSGAERPLASLGDAAGRRLVLLLSDAVSPAWYRGAIPRLISDLGRRCLVVLVQMLPGRLWHRTALSLSTSAQIYATARPRTNLDLRSIVPRRPGRARRMLQPRITALPVVTLEADALAKLAVLITGRAQITLPGFLVAPAGQPIAPPSTTRSTVDAAPLVESFYSTASQTARQLAISLAAIARTTRINEEVARLIQRATQISSRQVHLAEILLSGLLKPADGAGAQVFEFRDGVTDLLLAGVAQPYARKIRHQVAQYIERNRDSPSSFTLLVADSAGAQTGGASGQPLITSPEASIEGTRPGIGPLPPEDERVPPDAPPPVEAPEDLAALAEIYAADGVVALEQALLAAAKRAPQNQTLAVLQRHIARYSFVLSECGSRESRLGAFATMLARNGSLALLASEPTLPQDLHALRLLFPVIEMLPPDLFRIVAFDVLMRSCALSFDGSLLALGTDNGTVAVYEVATGRQRFGLARAHQEHVFACAFTPDGATLVTAGLFDGLAIWDVATGELRRRIPCHPIDCAVSPDGRRVIAALDEDGGEARVWDLERGVELLALSRGNLPPGIRSNGCAYSPDGSTLAVSFGNNVTLWDATNGSLLRELRGHADSVYGLAFSPDGSQLASGAADKRAIVWDVEAGRALQTLAGHTGPVWRCRYSPDGAQLFTGSWDETVGIWDTATGELLTRLANQRSRVLDLAVTAPLFAVVEGSRLAQVRSREWPNPAGSRAHTSTIMSCVASPDGALVATGGADGLVLLWDTATGQVQARLSGHTTWVYDTAFSDDGSKLVSASRDGSVRLWDVAGEQLLAVFQTETGASPTTMSDVNAGLDQVACNSDASWIAAAALDGSLVVWGTGERAVRRVIPGSDSDRIAALGFFDDARLVTVDFQQRLSLWNMGQLQKETTGTFPIKLQWGCKVFGALVATAIGDRSAFVVYNLQEQRQLYSFTLPEGTVTTLAFSPDERFVAANNAKGAVYVWELATGSLQAGVQLDSLLNGCAWLPDGRLVVGGRHGVYFLALPDAA